MAKGKGKGKSDKDPYKNLSDEFKEKVAMGSAEEIQEEAAKVAMAQEEQSELKEADEDYKRCAMALSVAKEPYSEAAKANKLKMRYIRATMKSRGLA